MQNVVVYSGCLLPCTYTEFKIIQSVDLVSKTMNETNTSITILFSLALMALEFGCGTLPL